MPGATTVLATLLLAGSSVAAQDAPDGPAPLPEIVLIDDLAALADRLDQEAERVPDDPCDQFDGEYPSWIDRSQVRLYDSVCTAAAWFDGFFGDARYDSATGETYGRVSLGGFYDERNGFDPQLKFRTRFALPALRNRGDFFFNRGTEEGQIEQRGSEGFEDDLQSVASNQDDSLFAGFGINRFQGIERGFSLRVGARIRLSPEPFVQARYRYGVKLTDSNLLRFEPLVYWRSDEKFGSTLNIDSDNYIGENLLLRWSNFGNVSDDPDVTGMAWGSTLSLFQGLSNRRALTYSLLVRGETEAPVKLQNYGFELRLRHRFLRKWLFLEYVGSVTFPQEFREEQRDANLGIGLRLESYFGPAPDAWVR